MTGYLHFDALPQITEFFELADFAVQSIEVVAAPVVPASGHTSQVLLAVGFVALLARSSRRSA